MPYIIRKNRGSNTYKVTKKEANMPGGIEIYAYRTKDPQKLIAAIEINKKIQQAKKKRTTKKK